jgi:hypothetical protein
MQQPTPVLLVRVLVCIIISSKTQDFSLASSSATVCISLEDHDKELIRDRFDSHMKGKPKDAQAPSQTFYSSYVSLPSKL